MEGSSVEEKLRDKLFEMLMKVLIIAFNISELRSY